jgi:hypothetical protein
MHLQLFSVLSFVIYVHYLLFHSMRFAPGSISNIKQRKEIRMKAYEVKKANEMIRHVSIKPLVNYYRRDPNLRSRAIVPTLKIMYIETYSFLVTFLLFRRLFYVQ